MGETDEASYSDDVELVIQLLVENKSLKHEINQKGLL